jgi:hypothetical protein
VASKVAHGGRIALTNFDKAGMCEALQRFADGGSGYAKHLGQGAFARQRRTRREFAPDDVVK